MVPILWMSFTLSGVNSRGTCLSGRSASYLTKTKDVLHPVDGKKAQDNARITSFSPGRAAAGNAALQLGGSK
jgi:hypothetical protein